MMSVMSFAPPPPFIQETSCTELPAHVRRCCECASVEATQDVRTNAVANCRFYAFRRFHITFLVVVYLSSIIIIVFRQHVLSAYVLARVRRCCERGDDTRRTYERSRQLSLSAGSTFFFFYSSSLVYFSDITQLYFSDRVTLQTFPGGSGCTIVGALLSSQIRVQLYSKTLKENCAMYLFVKSRFHFPSS
jgi:hypothetical protein